MTPTPPPSAQEAREIAGRLEVLAGYLDDDGFSQATQDTRSAIAALRHYASLLEGQGWRDIETAPKQPAPRGTE